MNQKVPSFSAHELLESNWYSYHTFQLNFINENFENILFVEESKIDSLLIECQFSMELQFFPLL